MIEITYPSSLPNDQLRYAVIVSRHKGQWIYVQHQDRVTYEIAGGHREAGELIDDAARRELYEETGAVEFTLHPVTVYTVSRDGRSSSGMLYYAEVHAMGPLPEMSEIQSVHLMDTPPDALTYPEIQPHLFQKVQEYIASRL